MKVYFIDDVNQPQLPLQKLQKLCLMWTECLHSATPKMSQNISLDIFKGKLSQLTNAIEVLRRPSEQKPQQTNPISEQKARQANPPSEQANLPLDSTPQRIALNIPQPEQLAKNLRQMQQEIQSYQPRKRFKAFNRSPQVNLFFDPKSATSQDDWLKQKDPILEIQKQPFHTPEKRKVQSKVEQTDNQQSNAEAEKPQSKVTPAKEVKASSPLKKEVQKSETGESDQKKLKVSPFKGRPPKCKFFPGNCAKGRYCSFNHPPACKNFKNCKFGDTCIFHHVECPSKNKCQVLLCPYAHQASLEARMIHYRQSILGGPKKFPSPPHSSKGQKTQPLRKYPPPKDESERKEKKEKRSKK